MKKFNGRISPLVLAAIMAAQTVATPLLNSTAYASEADVEAEISKNEFGGYQKMITLKLKQKR